MKIKEYIDYKYASKIYNEILTNSKTTNGIEYYYKPKYINSNILKYLKEYLADDSNFDKLLYKYLIKSGSVTGEQVCAIVYEQGILPMDDST